MASVIITGFSYGQGSSREHAALCPAHLGVTVVIAKSIERIHMANLVNFGILTLIFNDFISMSFHQGLSNILFCRLLLCRLEIGLEMDLIDTNRGAGNDT